MIPFKEEKDAKKEAFRKYLESSGVVDALTKALVSLYEQNEKPSAALEFIQQKLGGPSASDYEKLQAELSDLKTKFNQLSISHQEICKELEEVKSSCNEEPSLTKESSDGETQKDRL
ncbi:hypothetical protein CsatB_028909 [Cannabis sativa]|uniref:c-Myc-binding protein homolog n=2 Tax=Cannabis sativa TaxID=3483 RepID=A0AB40E8R4_CANSA|nr:uncharacterized protein LOC115718415 isoform X2 [Cannabis sativa]KAF4350432.1 hypothetical protein F8388_005456 [Cannabis sativa]KAF4373375.1 hypothetical protein F8388_026206 [Cannabis sativa]KAF4377322.1 hypothetical protein G4B88_011157 [Cannabis sativa]